MSAVSPFLEAFRCFGDLSSLSWTVSVTRVDWVMFRHLVDSAVAHEVGLVSALCERVKSAKANCHVKIRESHF